MSDKLGQAISIYTILEQRISEQDFITLADIAKTQGGLGKLYQAVKSRVEEYRESRDTYTVGGELDLAEEQQECLSQVERQLAIVEYLQFA